MWQRAAVVFVVWFTPVGALGQGSTPAPECIVSGRASVSELEVSLEGERRPVELSVSERRINARIPRGRDATSVTVFHPIEFEARTRAPIPYAVQRDADLLGRLLHVSRGTEVRAVRWTDDDALTADFALAYGVTVRDIPIDCALLELADHSPALPPARLLDEGVIARGRRLTVHQTPDSETSVTVEFARAREVRMTAVSERDGWTRVWASFPSGAGFHGFVASTSVRSASGDYRIRPLPTRELVQTIGTQCSPSHAGYYHGAATLVAGAELFPSSTATAAWASVPVDVRVQVRTVRDAGWAMVTQAPGIRSAGRCPEVLPHGWVRREHVRFPRQNENDLGTLSVRSGS
ncbi:MAG: hypothetical protein AAGF12_07000 [Myxococcota bacterium]